MSTIQPAKDLQPKGFVQKFLPHIIVLVAFLIIASIFCMPYLQGNKLLPHDVEQFLMMSKESRDYKEATGQVPFWTNNVFSGMPNALTDPYYENNWLGKIKNWGIFYKHGEMMNPIMLFFWCMLGAYILGKSLKFNNWIAAIVGIAFAFSTYNPIIIAAGHSTKMLDIAYMPGVLAGIILTYRNKYWLGAAVTAVFLSFFIDAGHYQIIYYTIFAVVAIGISELIKSIKRNTIKQFAISTIILVCVGALAAGTSASRLMWTNEATKYTTRGTEKELRSAEADKGLDKDYAFRWSNGVEETLGVLVPNLFGGGASMNMNYSSDAAEKLTSMGIPEQQLGQLAYWGPQQSDGLSGSVYFGATICFLAILSLLVVRSKDKWWVLAAGVFLIMISWGKNFSALNFLLFDNFPLMNKFRSPNMAIAISSLMFPVLAGWALNDIVNGFISKEVLLKKLKQSLIITGGLVVLIIIAIYTSMDFAGAMDNQIFGQNLSSVASTLKSFRQGLASADAFRSLIFILLTAGVIYLFITEKINHKITIAVVALLVIFDVLPVAKRYLGEDKYLDEYSYEQRFAARPVDQQIMQDKSYYRVLDLSRDLFNSASSSYHHKTIGGYHPAKLQIYQDLIERQIGSLNSAVINMLNGKYIITPAQKGQPVVIPNDKALGNAWFVQHLKSVNSAEDEMNALNAPSIQNPDDVSKGSFDPSVTAIVRNTELSKLNNASSMNVDSSANIRLESYDPMKLVYKSSNKADGVAVFSEIYYPKDWVALVDGKEVEIARVNYVLRAINVPAGEHTIEMIYKTPESYKKGEMIALIASILIVLLVVVGIYMNNKKTIAKA